MKILIIIPAYNEALNIGSVLDDIRTAGILADLLVVDDGSSDATSAVARSKGATVLRLPFNMGIGAAVQTGYKYAERGRYDVAVQFDGDGQHRADELETVLLPLMRGEADVVIGSRFLKEGCYDAEIYRYAGIKLLSWVISLCVCQRITDPTSGFRAINRDAIEFFAHYYPDDYPEPEAIVLLRKARFRTVEIPVFMRQRNIGNSSITLLRGIYYMGKVLLAIGIDMFKKVSRR